MGGRPRVSIHISKATATGKQCHCIQGHGIIVQGDIICRYVLNLIRVHLHWTRASTLRSVATRSLSEKQSNLICPTRQTLRSHVNISNVFVCCKVNIAMFGITRGGAGSRETITGQQIKRSRSMINLSNNLCAEIQD